MFPTNNLPSPERPHLRQRFTPGVSPSAKMAGNRGDHGLKALEGIGPGKDGVSQGAGLVTAFRGFRNRKDDLALRHKYIRFSPRDYTPDTHANRGSGSQERRVRRPA